MTDKSANAMTDPVNEQLSACLDGELPAAELDLLLKRMARDEALARTASRYSLAGAAMRDSQGPLASVDFAARVASAVAAEEKPLEAQPLPARRRFEPRRWVRPAISGTMAAGIAVFAVLIATRPDQGASDTPEVVAENTPVTAPLTTPAPAPTPVNWSAARLTNYVVAHSEYSSPLSRPMVLNGVLAEQNVPEERDQLETEPVDSAP